MQKFLTNSASLQRRIDEDEGVKQLEPATAPEEACEDDATYAKAQSTASHHMLLIRMTRSWESHGTAKQTTS